jgi:hypothetical protein
MIIGIIGKARSGKDTFAEMLADVIYKRFGKRFILMAYAQELKLRVQRDFDLTYEQLWGEDKEIPDQRYEKRFTTTTGTVDDYTAIYWTAREIMQAYGEFYRSIDREFWVKNLFKVIDENGHKNVIVTDVRHPNEADPIKERKSGYIFRVTSERSNKPGIHGENHISETAMDDYTRVDLHIKNDGSLDELYKEAEKALQFLVEAESKGHLEVT